MRLHFPTTHLIQALLISVSATLFLFSCDSSTDIGTTTEKSPTVIKTDNIEADQSIQLLTAKFKDIPNQALVLNGDTIANAADIKKAYEQQSYAPFWLSNEGISQNTIDYLNVLKSIHYDGLDSKSYQLDFLNQQLNQIKSSKMNQDQLIDFDVMMTSSFLNLSKDMLLGTDTAHLHAKDWKNKNDSSIDFGIILQKTIQNNDVTNAIDLMRPQHNYYKAFRNEYIRLDSIQKLGGWNTKLSKAADSAGIESSQITQLRKRLFLEIGIPADTITPTWTTDLSESVKRFQYLNYAKQTGTIDSVTLRKLNIGIESKLNSLALNMERMRWMKHDFPQPYIWVTVPKMELDYVEKDSVQFNMRVVVGRPGRPTTMLDARLQNIVFSPPWTVPPTIMKEEVVPGIARRGGSYLARRGLKAYDRRGRVVSASAINSKNYRSFSIGQAPGYRSSLGEVKFNLPNPWSIYLHDTPHREDFVKFYRAYSSGCIRVHHPKEFAAFLLRDTASYSYEKIDSICKKRQTIFVPMKRDVQVHIVYLTNAIDSTGTVMFLKDIYDWDKRS